MHLKFYLCLIIFILTSHYTFAACPIDGNTTACTVAEFQQQQPMHRSYSTKPFVKEFSGSPEARLKPRENEQPSKELRDFGPKPADYSYNTNCQFGVCNPSGTPQLFENRGQ